jgi:hypothetical protein
MRKYLLASLMFGAAACGMPLFPGDNDDLQYSEGEVIAAPDMYRITDSGVRCARAPCPSLRVSPLTQRGEPVQASSIEFPSEMAQDVRQDASNRVITPEGLVAHGSVVFHAEGNVFVLRSLPER